SGATTSRWVGSEAEAPLLRDDADGGPGRARIDQPLETGDTEVDRLAVRRKTPHRRAGELLRLRHFLIAPDELHAEGDDPLYSDAEPAAGQHHRPPRRPWSGRGSRYRLRDRAPGNVRRVHGHA